MFQAPNRPPFMQQGPGFGPGPFPNNMSNQFQQFPNTMAPSSAQPRGLQGLLGRLFNKNTGNAMQSAMQSGMQPSMQIPAQLKTATESTGGLTHSLGNVQPVLKVAQQATPLIRGYGRMVKNAPKLISMLKAFSEMQEDDESDNEQDSEEVEKKDDEFDNDLDALFSDEDDELDLNEDLDNDEGDASPPETRKKITRSRSTGESTPKLFI